MSKKHKDIFNWGSDELEGLYVPEDLTVEFHLFLPIAKLAIGTLMLKNGEWHFSYSEDFKLQTKYKPLVNFPDITKHYSSKQLWPFFASRIPGLGQPIVQQFLEKNKLSEPDEVSLLKEFGKRTISNPYVLESA